MTEKKIRVLISKLGLDGHDRGAKLVAHALKGAGMEVIYLGIRQTIREVVATAIEKQVEFLGLSFLAGDHMTMVPKVIGELKNQRAHDIKLIVGGIILEEQIPGLKAMGVRQVFLPGVPLKEIENYIRENSSSQKAPE